MSKDICDDAFHIFKDNTWKLIQWKLKINNTLNIDYVYQQYIE